MGGFSFSEEAVSALLASLVGFGKKVLFALLIYFIGRKLIQWALKLLDHLFERTRLDLSASAFLRNLLKIGSHVILVIIVAGYLGVDGGSIVAVVGSAGLALGLALQGSLSNFAGGVLLLILKPFRVGDYIITCGNEGTVSGMDIFYTKLLSGDNRMIVIPNGTLSNSSIVNVTNETKRRIDILVGIDYSEDIRKVKEVLRAVVDRQDKVLAEEESLIYVSSFDASAITMGVRVWVATEDYWLVKWSMMEQIKYAFDENEITIPFDQLDVNVNQKQE